MTGAMANVESRFRKVVGGSSMTSNSFRPTRRRSVLLDAPLLYRSSVFARVVDEAKRAARGSGMILLEGESGSGKSVLSYAISGVLDPAAVVVGGVIEWRGRPAEFLREQRVPKLPIAQVFQSPRTSLNPTRTIGRQLADVAGAARVASLLRSVRLAEARASAYPAELSGGQCQRVSIALALGREPELLVADEPTTGLDVLTEAAILDLIADLARQRGMATLLVTHDLALAVARCTRLGPGAHSGQRIPTGVEVMQSGQIGRPQLARLRERLRCCAVAPALTFDQA